MRYVSTRGRSPAIGFWDAVLAGLAPDGGLYIPESWPSFTTDEIAALGPDLVKVAKILKDMLPPPPPAGPSALLGLVLVASVATAGCTQEKQLALVEILALLDVLHHFCVDEFVFPAQLHPGDRCELLAFALQQLRGTNGDMRFKVFDMRNGSTLSPAIRRALRHASIGPYELEVVQHVSFY